MGLTHKDIALPDVPCDGDLDLKIGICGSDEVVDMGREDFYRDLREDRTQEWADAVASYEEDPEDFWASWWYLDMHPAFWTFRSGQRAKVTVTWRKFLGIPWHRRVTVTPDERHHEKYLIHENGIKRCVDITLAQVNPATRRVEDDTDLNTETEVWIELGQAPWIDDEEQAPYHDYMLDCGGPTVEAAIIQAARNVWEVYGNDRRVCDGPYDESNYAAVMAEEEEGEE